MTEAADIRAIEAMYDEALAAFQAGDLDSVVSHWHEDGVYLWPEISPARGRAAIRDAYEGFFARWTAKETYYPHEIRVSGDLGYRRFSTDLTLTPSAGGEPRHLNLQGLHVYGRDTEGLWKFRVVIAIAVPPDTPHV